ncbi:MAG: class I SAM-dependent methyltransferase [Tannerella sp.]|jgi:ubiquinone/menaquinone biosynthesis C-methylase UbiE|nr:class I SAM-dependent methyltransferase [Tannerella sp.]
MTYQSEKIFPYRDSGVPKGVQIEKMFDAIAGQYDALNHTLSFGMDYFPMKQAYRLYSRIVILLIGRIVSGNIPAYRYLNRSIAAFPQCRQMKAILKKKRLLQCAI